MSKSELPKITKTKSGKYHASLNYYTPEGKRSTKSFTAPDKSRLILDILAFQAEQRQIERMTLGDAVDRYISSKSAVLSPSTVKNYQAIRRVAYPDLMPVMIDKLTTERLQIAVNAHALTASPKTVRNHYGLITAALAVYRPDLNTTVTMPQRKANKIRIPTTAEVRALFAAARGTEMELPVILAATIGMRRSEICALTSEDVDFDRGVIMITKALVESQGGGFVEKPPKTATSAREVKPFPWVLDLLKTACEQSSRQHRLFIAPNALSKRFEHLCNKAKIVPCRFHDLRHYAASAMLGQGFPKSYAAAILGHDSERMLDEVYGHLMLDVKEELEDRLNAYFQGVFGANDLKNESKEK